MRGVDPLMGNSAIVSLETTMGGSEVEEIARGSELRENRRGGRNGERRNREVEGFGIESLVRTREARVALVEVGE